MTITLDLPRAQTSRPGLRNGILHQAVRRGIFSIAAFDKNALNRFDARRIDFHRPDRFPLDLLFKDGREYDAFIDHARLGEMRPWRSGWWRMMTHGFVPAFPGLSGALRRTWIEEVRAHRRAR